MMLAGILALGLLMVNATDALAADATATVSASATLTAAYTLNVQPKNVSDNTNATAIAFGNVSTAGWVASPQYVEIAYASNEAGWIINMYTNNTASTATINRGGMLGGTHLDQIVPLLVGMYDSVQATPDHSTWDYVMDKQDGLYSTLLTVAYGDQTTSHLGGHPNGTVVCSSPVDVYVGADFTGKPADTYSTTINIDLYHL